MDFFVLFWLVFGWGNEFYDFIDDVCLYVDGYLVNWVGERIVIFVENVEEVVV